MNFQLLINFSTFSNAKGGTLSCSEVSSFTHADGMTSALADKIGLIL